MEGESAEFQGGPSGYKLSVAFLNAIACVNPLYVCKQRGRKLQAFTRRNGFSVEAIPFSTGVATDGSATAPRPKFLAPLVLLGY